MADMLIAGCGDVGTRLGRLLDAQGHRVWGLRRQPEILPEPLIPLARDLSQPFSLADITPPRLVFYTAAAGARDEDRYRRIYLDGLKHLLAALNDLAVQPERIFFTSSTAVYGTDRGEWVDEDTPPQPSSFSGRIMLAAEQLLAESPIASTAVRLSGIYGPGRDWLLRLAQNGATCPAEPPRFSNRIHSQDCAAALSYLASMPQPAPLYLASDHQPAPLHQVLAWIRAELATAGIELENSGRSLPQRGNKRCRNHRLLDTGFKFQFPDYRSGYASLIQKWANSARTPAPAISPNKH